MKKQNTKPPAVEAEEPAVTQQAKAKPAAKAPVKPTGKGTGRGKGQQKQLGNYFPSAIPAGGGNTLDYTLDVVVAPSLKPKVEAEDDDTDVN